MARNACAGAEVGATRTAEITAGVTKRAASLETAAYRAGPALQVGIEIRARRQET